MLSREYRVIVRKLLINHFLLGIDECAKCIVIEEKKDDFVAEAWHGEFSNTGFILCL